MQNYNEILEKLKDILSKELDNKKIFDKDIAQALNINYDVLRKAKQYNRVPYLEIMQFLAKRNISINWFFFNQLPESLIENTSNYIILKYQKNIISSAGGGAINYEINPEPLVIDKQLLDYINSNYKYTEVLQVFGESMEPDIKDGSLIFVDKSKKDINDKDIFLINTKDGLYVKHINLYNDKVILKSNNQAFNDIKLDIDEINIVGRVCGVLVKI
ncbi:S24 family peptidase [Aliarcobacter butzleri]|uniref:S24 family peptidase n=1 Tax=Aliarcobacter butzleri TaxID=28197 RepID=UPI00263DF208|nr:S24 family peptidase [Aliarcobacter butzleri]MDN5049822.1 S24 family peptidase [Aliarcobacter butzleri]MDN5056861.1 S24 family peptidase [Aliarcobacter butzleri]